MMHRQSMHHRAMVGGDEVDAFSAWSRVMTWRPGDRKAVKQRANRRDRRATRQALRFEK